MIAAVNAVLECLVTGFFTALILWGMSKIGMFPVAVQLVMTMEELSAMEKEAEEDDEF